MADADHFDIDTAPREGYFEKMENGMPLEDYRDSCSDGFKGSEWEAHHVLPDTSFAKSVGELPTDKRTYVKQIQYITPWNINHSGNMLGMPNFRSFLFYYQNQDGLTDANDPTLDSAVEQSRGARGKAARVTRYINTFNKRLEATRKSYYQNISISPETYAIHLPTSWGHTFYDKKVKKELKEQVWNTLNEQQKQHKVDAGNVAALLKSLSTKHKGSLTGRDTTRSKWDKRYDPNDKWYLEFAMDDRIANPLFK